MKRATTISLVAFMVLGVSAAVRAEAIDGSIFSEDFNNLSQWFTKYNPGGGTATVADGKATLQTTTTGGGIILLTDPALNFSATPNDWWVETSFNVVAATEMDGKPTVSYRQWVLLSGSNSTASPAAPLNYIRGFDLRAITGDTTDPFQLGWYGWDNAAPDGSNRAPEVIGTNVNLNKGQFYNVKLHRKNDGNVDIYLNDALIDTKAMIGGNPTIMWMGDYSSSGVTGTVIYDYMRVGQAVPEPSTLALLACGLAGLLAYAGKKRK